MAINESGDGSGNKQTVTAEKSALVRTDSKSVIRNFSENDAGLSSGIPYLVSPEVDDDYRLRVSNDVFFDDETFSYTAQNTTKHVANWLNFVPSWTLSGFNTNPTSVLTSGSVTHFTTRKTFSIIGTETLSIDFEGSFYIASGATVPANSQIEIGLGMPLTTPFDCFDGAYVRVNQSGTALVLRNNSITDSAVSGYAKDPADGVTTWQPVSGRKYQFILYITPRDCELWMNDTTTSNGAVLIASVETPVGFGMPTASPAVPFFVRQYNSGLATIASQFTLSRYNVRRGGANLSTSPNIQAARAYESAYSIGTLGTTQTQVINAGSITRPTATVPSNLASSLASLGGIYLETLTLATGNDGILMSYQVPALPTAVATTFAPNRRLRIDGVAIATGIQTALTGGGFSKFFYIAYGSTSVSLAGVAADTTTTATTKSYRRVHLPIVQNYPTGLAAGASVGASMSYFALQTPIYVNPGEFIALVTYHAGTVASVGVAQHAIQFDFSWE